VHVVVLVEALEECFDLGARIAFEVHRVLAAVADLGGGHAPASLLQGLGDRIHVGALGEEAAAALFLFDDLELLDVLRAGFDRRGLEVETFLLVRRLDDADLVEQEHHLAAEIDRRK
jgi:hypothetical protein